MCNLYQVRTNQEAMRDIASAMQKRLNLQPGIEVYPDRPAPVVRNKDGERELLGLTWGMPTPAISQTPASPIFATSHRLTGANG